MPGAETVKLQVELVEKNAEARLKELDKLAKEMGNRKITLNFDESSLARWKAATDGMTNAQLSAYAKMVTAAESANAKIIAAGEKSTQVEMQQNAKLVTERQKSIDKKIELWEKEDTKRRQIAEKTAQTEINANAKVQVATLKGVRGTRQQTQAQKELNTEAQKTDSIFSSITSRFTAANLISGLITRGITLLRNALRQAVDEMKEMDKELTTIKMVTGASDSDISALRQQAFAGARDTGRTTSDYLSAAERFARAGYRENIQDLTKLSLVTQNVGGVTEDVASKFILAADAAWKMGGSTERLWSMLDGVTAIADQNATDIGKIAEAYTVAGSAFANAGESERTFAALIGTTTAATQRSGSEMARGLQTILFRVRQVKGELDDGEMIEAEDISNAAKALDSVGISVLNDAKELKSFTEIMGELNKKWDTLNTKQKAYLQNALAGNRRGNVLFSLMDNYDVYQKQLEQFDEASGTALEKNAIFTESWAASTNNLKTSWTELIDTMTESGSILQGVIDLTTSLIDKISTFTHEFQREDSIFWFFKHLDNYSWEAAPDGNFRLRRKDILEEDNKALEKAEEAQNALAEATIQVIKSHDEEAEAVDQLSTAFSKANDNIKKAAENMKDEKDSSIKSAADIYKAMKEAAEKGYYGSNAYKEGAKLFFGTSDKDAIGQIAQDALDAYFDAISKGDYSNAAASLWGSFADESGDIVDKTTGEVIASMHDAGDSYEWAFNKGNKSISEFLASMESATGVGADFWASMIRSLGMYSDEMDKWMQENIEEPEPELTIKADTDQAQSAIENINKMLDGIKDKTVRVNIIQSISGSSVSNATQTVHQAATEQAIKEGGANSYMWSGYASSKGLQQRAGGKRDNYSGIALVNDEFPADGSKPELIISKSQGRAYIANGGKPALVNLRSDDIVLTAKETQSTLDIPGFPVGKNIKESFDKNEVLPLTVKTPKDPNAGEKPGGGGGSEAAADSGASWDQLKKLIDYMIDKEKDVLDDKLKILDDQLKELEAARKSQNRMDELAQKLVAVDEAQLDLQKAQSERTVRYYNESTHQWEWMADQGTLAKAEEAYATALKNLNDFLIDLDFEKQKEAIQAQKDALQEAFDAYKEGWDTIVDAIEAPTGDLVELFQDLKVNGTEAMKSQAENIEHLLDALETGFFAGIEDNTLASQTALANMYGTLDKATQDSMAIAQNAINNILGRSQEMSSLTTDAAKEALSGMASSSKDAMTDIMNRAQFAVLGMTTDTQTAASGMAESVSGAAESIAETTSDAIQNVVKNANDFLNSVKNAEKAKAEAEKKDASQKTGGGGDEEKPKEKEPVLKTNTGNNFWMDIATGLATATIDFIKTATGSAQDLLKKTATGVFSSLVETVVTSTVNNNGGNTYMNGVKIGNDQMNNSLSNVLTALKLHANMSTK